MNFGGFQNQAHQSSSTYVDPTMLTANRMVNANNDGTSFQPHQAYLAQSYFKQGSTVDPRSLQGGQPMQPVAPASSHSAQRVGSAVVPKPEKMSKPKDPHAPRKPKGQGKPKADGQPGSESDSDDELSIQEEEPPEMTPALLTVSAPTDERGKALYNAVQAVWSPRNKPASPEKVRSGIVGFADTVRALRDAWKAKNDVLRKAELPNSPTAGDAVALKDEVARYRQVTESVMARSLLYGHPSIVKRYVVPRTPFAVAIRTLSLILPYGYILATLTLLVFVRPSKAVRQKKGGFDPCISVWWNRLNLRRKPIMVLLIATFP